MASSSNLGLSGIASGVDTSAIIEKLMTLERQSTTRLQLSQAKLQTRDDALKNIQTKLTDLKTAATALKDPKLWVSKSAVETSDATKLGVTLTGGAPIGSTSVEILGLASSSQRAFGFTQSSSARTLTFTPSAGGTPTTLNVAADATVDSIAASINDRTDLPVYAAVIVPDPSQPTVKQLVLSSRTTGSDSDFTAALDDGSLNPLSAKVGANATYKLNGDPAVLSSQTNTVANAVPGVTLQLKGTTAGSVSMNVTAPTANTEAIKSKVQAFVAAYNAVVTTTNTSTTEKSDPKATTTQGALAGQLFGDSGLTSMIGSLRRGMTDVIGGNATTNDDLGDFGITSGAIGAGKNATSGQLVIDVDKLTSAITADPTSLRKMLGGITGTDGLAQRIEGLVDGQVGTNGLIKGRLNSSVSDQKRITDAITRDTARLDAKEARYKAQFAAMETALQQSQTQSSWLSGQIAQLG